MIAGICAIFIIFLVRCELQRRENKNPSGVLIDWIGWCDTMFWVLPIVVLVILLR